MRKLEIESWEELIAKEMASFDTADDGAEELWATDGDGLVYDELLCSGERCCDHRWELDPASAEDYFERTRGWLSGPSLKWRHFGH